MTVVLAVTWVAREGEREAVTDLLQRLAPQSRAEPGCLQYDAHVDPDDPDRFFLFERYVDEAALEAHLGGPHFQQLVLEEALPRLASTAAPQTDSARLTAPSENPSGGDAASRCSSPASRYGPRSSASGR